MIVVCYYSTVPAQRWLGTRSLGLRDWKKLNTRVLVKYVKAFSDHAPSRTSIRKKIAPRVDRQTSSPRASPSEREGHNSDRATWPSKDTWASRLMAPRSATKIARMGWSSLPSGGSKRARSCRRRVASTNPSSTLVDASRYARLYCGGGGGGGRGHFTSRARPPVCVSHERSPPFTTCHVPFTHA